MIDYHVHTNLCNHASGTMPEYVQQAIAAGLTEICFLDHLTLNEKGRDLSMKPGDVPLYFYAAKRLAHQYRDRIAVKVGLEIDFSPAYIQPAEDIINRFAFDVIGGSVHFVEDYNIVSSRAADLSAGPPEEILYERYLDCLQQMVDSRIFDVVCHIDVVKKFGRLPPVWFYENLDEILTKIGYNGLTVEINTSGLTHPAGSIYPDGRTVEKCREKGIFVTLGSDAHRPDQVGQHFDRAYDLLKSAGIEHVSGFDRRNRYDVFLTAPDTEAFPGGEM